MQREIQSTADGSHTVSIPELAVTYHSKHGAVQESMHVFIQAGLKYTLQNTTGSIAVLEVGLGTALNALLSWQFAKQQNRLINYTAIEKFPLTIAEAEQINYGDLLSMQHAFIELHNSAWETANALDPLFTFRKINTSLQDFETTDRFHCIYFDAFAPTAQPELCTTEVFQKMLSLLMPGGVLVTYCSKSIVRRAMQAAGFRVEKIPGPIGKREMVRAHKPE